MPQAYAPMSSRRIRRLTTMGRLIYMTIASLDGYVADREGDFGWAAPGEEAHAFVNDLVRPVGTHLYGRRMYETMRGWETDPSLAAHGPVTADFAAIWQAAEKIVYSRTLTAVDTARTRIERTFDPAAVRAMKAAAPADLTVSGPGLAAHALRAGLVDDLHLLLAPAVVGGGNPALPADLRLQLELRGQRSFPDGMVYLRYACTGS
jgi:dihydrofolate reductase